MLEVDRQSITYRLARFYVFWFKRDAKYFWMERSCKELDDYWESQPKDLCTLIRTAYLYNFFCFFFMTLFYTIGISLLYLAFTNFFQGVQILFWVSITIAIIICLVMGAAFLIVNFLHRYDWREKLNKTIDKVDSPLPVEWIKAKKRKMCPLIVYKGE